MTEIWRDIEGYVGCYQVSNLGKVKSLKYGKERILTASKSIYGYLIVNLRKDGKQKHYLIHRLVASAFLPNIDNLPQVNHIDEDKTNNRVENLEWCSAEYNSNFGTRNKRSGYKRINHTSKSKKVLCVETGKIYPSAHQVERDLGFLNGNISKVCNCKRKSAYGYTWRYV
ncbi:MAG: NUMOD4 motif-containing HNH endonuclease [Bacteroidales bacterium]|nr:NUMOD4 motif-containing HNH endonuclease [Bacteroidales bacterium]